MAIRMQQLLSQDDSGIKDIEAMIEEGLLTPALIQLGVPFLEFVESFYDESGNYTELGLSEEGKDFLWRYKDKHGYSLADFPWISKYMRY